MEFFYQHCFKNRTLNDLYVYHFIPKYVKNEITYECELHKVLVNESILIFLQKNEIVFLCNKEYNLKNSQDLSQLIEKGTGVIYKLKYFGLSDLKNKKDAIIAIPGELFNKFKLIDQSKNKIFFLEICDVNNEESKL